MKNAARKTQKKRTRKPRKRPVKRIPGLYYRTNITPERFFEELGKLRQEAEIEIDRLIAFLDSIEDTDVDAACDDSLIDGDFDNEPSLGSIELHPTPYTTYFNAKSQEHWASGNGDDLEAADDEQEGDGLEEGELDSSDDEPSLCGISADDPYIDGRDGEMALGSFDRMMDQTKSTVTKDPQVGYVATDAEVDGCDRNKDIAKAKKRLDPKRGAHDHRDDQQGGGMFDAKDRYQVDLGNGKRSLVVGWVG